ncbi:MAG: M4 family metallopeptidase [Aquaticitalea sp.]
MKRFTGILIVFLLIGFMAKAQDFQKTIAILKQETNAIVTQNEDTGLADFVRFPIGKSMSVNGTTLQQKALSFLKDYKAIFNIESVEQSLNFDTVKTDSYGLINLTLKQTYHGVPVFDGLLRFHFNSERKLTAINGNYISGISKLNHVPTLKSNQANNIALNAIRDQGLNGSGKPLSVHKNMLYVFSKGLIQGQVTATHLVYEVEVWNELDVREFLYIDAHSGEIVEQFTGMAHALNRKVYENNVGNLIWKEGDVYPGTLNLAQRNLVQTSGQVYNFFKNAFGFISYNNADAKMRSINNHSAINCSNTPNANWNGSTANYCDGTAADDVIAHEWGHAYTEYTSGLLYAYQAGAINESYSDIWGETVDILNNYEDFGEDLTVRTNLNCNSSRWKIGEDATGFSGPLRDMWNPKCNGDPGKVTDGQYECGDNQAAIVHINSGIPNHAYALLVDGGTYNGQTINGLGFVKAAHIFWRAQTTYLTPTSNFSDLADALEAACSDLIGINLRGLSTTAISAGLSDEALTSTDLESVSSAILAVEMRINPDACSYEPILGPTLALCEAATSNPLFYENWESGLGDWTVIDLPSNPATWESRNWAINSNLPAEREGRAIFGIDPINGDCDTDLENGIIRLQSPLITIPDITNGIFYMAFNHYVATENKFDGGNIKYSLNGDAWTLLPSSSFTENAYNSVLNTTAQDNDNPMQGQAAFTGTDGGRLIGSWGQSVIDLSSLGVIANSTVQFRFELGTDGCNGNDGWYIDEITVYNCDARLSIADTNELKNSIKVFPNPSNGIYTLKNSGNFDLLNADIFDINGRKIKTINLVDMYSEKEIDITNEASGIYFMSITSKDAKTVIKLIKK